MLPVRFAPDEAKTSPPIILECGKPHPGLPLCFAATQVAVLWICVVGPHAQTRRARSSPGKAVSRSAAFRTPNCVALRTVRLRMLWHHEIGGDPLASEN